MEFEKFQEFMLQSAAQHDARIAVIEEVLRGLATDTRNFAVQTRDSINRLTNTTQVLVDNQVHLQDSLDRLAQETRTGMADLRKGLDELRVIVFKHVTDPNAHKQ